MKLAAALAVAAALVLAGCSGSSGGSDSSSEGGSASSSSSSSGSTGGGSSGGGSSCGDAGKDGVIRTFCDGSAKVTFDLGGTEGSVDGGTCETSGGYFVVNAGTVIDGSYKGTKPDYAGLLMPPADGDFSGQGKASGTITYGGEAVVLTSMTGSHDKDSGSFEGTSFDGKTKVSGSFTC